MIEKARADSARATPKLPIDNAAADLQRVMSRESQIIPVDDIAHNNNLLEQKCQELVRFR